MAITRLQLYNIALFAVGESAVASTNEDREPKNLLDELWARGNGLVDTVLETGLWNFAARDLAATSTATPSFAFSEDIAQPEDFIRIIQISTHTDFASPLLYYRHQAGHFYTNSDTIYLRYVSNDSTVAGGVLGNWPDSFSLYAGHYMATQIAPRLKNDIDIEFLEKRTAELLVKARLKDMSQSEPSWPPMEPNEVHPRALDYALELARISGSRARGEQ